MFKPQPATYRVTFVISAPLRRVRFGYDVVVEPYVHGHIDADTEAAFLRDVIRIAYMYIPKNIARWCTTDHPTVSIDGGWPMAQNMISTW